MAAYAQFGGFPTANQFLMNGGGTTLSTLSCTHPNVQSPLAAAPPSSPTSMGTDSCSRTNGGTITPDPASQTSNTAVLSVATTDSGSSSYPSCLANGAASASTTTTTPCCDNGRPVVTDPVSGQTVCSCQYDPARLALSNYTRIQSAAGVSVYGAPYPSNDQNPYPSISVDNAAPFYSTLGNSYALKETSNNSEVTAWTSSGLQPSAGYYTYDPTFGATYGYGAGYDLSARRKNATRESTATLKAWLNEHKKNPYPTKGEKIMLAIITKMTLTQVSTWFANARRRLKKENKMTWEPKNRTEDDDDGLASDDDEKEKDRVDHEATPTLTPEKRHGFGASVAAGNSSTAAADVAGANNMRRVGGSVVGSIDTGANVGVISAQTKDCYQLHRPQKSQYLENFYYHHSSQQQQQLPQQAALSALSQHISDRHHQRPLRLDRQ